MYFICVRSINEFLGWQLVRLSLNFFAWFMAGVRREMEDGFIDGCRMHMRGMMETSTGVWGRTHQPRALSYQWCPAAETLLKYVPQKHCHFIPDMIGDLKLIMPSSLKARCVKIKFPLSLWPTEAWSLYQSSNFLICLLSADYEALIEGFVAVHLLLDVAYTSPKPAMLSLP